MLDVLQEMQEGKFEVPVELFNGLFEAFSKLEDFSRLATLRKVMKGSNVEGNITTCYILMSAYFKKRDYEKAVSCFESMRKNWIVETAVNRREAVYLLAMQSYWKVGKIDDMVYTFEEFKAGGLGLPNELMYNVLLAAFGHKSDRTRQQQYLSDLLQSKLKPSVLTFNLVMETCGKAGDINKVISHMHQMQQLGIEPNLQSFHILLSTYGAKSDTKMVERVLQDMRSKNLDLQLSTYCILLASFGNAAQTEKVVELFEEMKAAGIRPNEIAYTITINALKDRGSTTEAQKYRNQMKADGLSSLRE
jgi:pentatricopeptide repeat protein